MKKQNFTKLMVALACACLLFTGNNKLEAQITYIPTSLIYILTAQGCCYRADAAGVVVSVHTNMTPYECALIDGGPGFRYHWAPNPCPVTIGAPIPAGLPGALAVGLRNDPGNETVAGMASKLIKVAPNPFYQDINIEYQAIAGERIWVQLFDLTGKQVYTREFVLASGLNAIQLNMEERLAKGAYFLRIRDGRGDFINKKIIKQ